jgi:hypothetical protein
MSESIGPGEAGLGARHRGERGGGDNDWEKRVEPVLRSEMAEGRRSACVQRCGRCRYCYPGKAKAFPVADLEAAKAWLAESGK